MFHQLIRRFSNTFKNDLNLCNSIKSADPIADLLPEWQQPLKDHFPAYTIQQGEIAGCIGFDV
jgi:hypothetical protein